MGGPELDFRCEPVADALSMPRALPPIRNCSVGDWRLGEGAFLGFLEEAEGAVALADQEVSVAVAVSFTTYGVL